MDNPNLTAALRLASLGIAVFPCNQTKRPQPGVRWKEEATTDEARIASWWRRWPSSLPAYQVGRHGMLAIDLDGDFGFEDWDKVRGDHEEPPVRLRTPGGGHHIFFKQDGSFGNSRGTLPPKRKNPVTSEDEGIDIRGAAGYVVAEGAVMPDGRTYEPVANYVGLVEALQADAVPALPEWLAEVLRDRLPAAEPTVQVATSREAVSTPAASGDSPSDFFRRVNDAALARLDNWVTVLFPGARHQPGTGAFRITSRQLGRNLQEDLSIAPVGIVDFGVADMGDPRAGKRSPIDLVQEYGGAPDAREASRWLCDRLGIDFDDLWRETHPAPDVEIRLKARDDIGLAEVVDDADEPDEEEGEAPPIDEALTHVDGVLGEMVDWIADCSPTGNRLLALSAALPLMGTLLGRRMATPTGGGGGLELYVISLLPSGGGKSVPMSAISRLMEVAGLDNQHIAPPEFRSGAAFGDFLCRAPLSLSIVDEVADYLAVMLADKQQSHQVELEKLMKEQWGKGFSSLRTAHSKTSGSGKIFAPCYSIYGATTPDAFFRTIKSRHITGGFANRLTVIDASQASRSDREPVASLRHPPEALVDAVRALYAMGAAGRGNLSSFIDKNSAVDPDPVIVPWGSQDAHDRFIAFEAECRALVADLGELGKIYGRTAFMAVKIATIRACGRTSPVTLTDMEWGIAIARQSADLFRHELANKMLDPLTAGELLQKIAQQFLKPTAKGQDLMAKYGAMTLPKRFLWNALKHHTSRHPGEFDSALKAMESGGEIRLGKMTVAGAKDSSVVQYLRRRRTAA